MMRVSIKNYLLLVCLFMSGCSLLSPVTDKPQNLYLLNPQDIIVPTAPRLEKTVLITEPVAAAGFSNNNLLYTTKPYQLESFSQNRWADSPAKMLAPLMVMALQKTNHYAAVISFPFAGKTDLRIDTQLVRFQQNFLKTPSEVEMAVLVRIIDATTQRVKASKTFDIHESAENNPYAGVIASNKATAQFLKEFSEFCIETTHRHQESLED